MKKVVLLMIIMSFAMCSLAHADINEEVLRELRALKARVIELEAKVQQYERQDMARTHDDHAGHDDHHGHDHAADEKWGPFGEHDHGGLDFDRISIHGGVDLRLTDAEEAEKDAVLQEAEIALEAELTDWLTGFVSITKENGESAAVEEAFGEMTIDEWNLKLKGGKYFVPFGALNQFEYFDRPTITRSPMEEDFFGEEPWIDTGATAQLLLPEFVDGWKSALTVGLFNGDNEASFGDDDEATSESNNNFPLLVRYQKHYEDDWGSLSGGFSFAHGNSDAAEDFETTVKGADLALNIGNFDFLFEYIHRDKEEAGNGLVGYGYDLSASYTVPLEYKYLEYVEFLFAYGMSDASESTEKERFVPQLTLGFTENTKLRFLYEFLEEKPTDTDNNRFISQFAFQF